MRVLAQGLESQEAGTRNRTRTPSPTDCRRAAIECSAGNCCGCGGPKSDVLHNPMGFPNANWHRKRARMRHN